MGVVGAILGDIAGSKYEAMPKMYLPDRYAPYPLYEEKGTDPRRLRFTDDTVLSLAVMDACIHGFNRFVGSYGFSPDNFKAKYIQYTAAYPAANYGSGFVAWVSSEEHQPYGSYGNGSAMRVSYIGQLFAGTFRGKKRTEVLAKMSAEPTHDHPEGIKGAVTEAVCVWMAENGATKDEILEYGKAQYPETDYIHGCGRELASYINTIKPFIACQDAVPFAIRCFYETESFEELMKLIRSMQCDTDTIGAIAGAIAESYYRSTVPNEKEVLEMYLPKSMLKMLHDGLVFAEEKKKY